MEGMHSIEQVKCKAVAVPYLLFEQAVAVVVAVAVAANAVGSD